MFKINELDVIGTRKLNYIPNHFVKIKINNFDNFDDNIESWISNRLSHRYSICIIPSIDSKGKLKNATYAAFENQKELTYFMLACPHFRRLS